MERFSRTQLLIGESGLKNLKDSRVAVFGIGGVGGYAAEALARAGVGAIDLIDGDKVEESNINRQIIALGSTVGRFKTEVMAERIRDINPDCLVTERRLFYLGGDEIDFSNFGYVVDAIDTVTGKLAIIEKAVKCGVPVISCMGTGNKLSASAFTVADISETSVCPLAKVMRRELKKRGILGVKVVYSREEPKKIADGVTASISYVPPVAGFIAAGEAIKYLAGLKNE